MGATGAIGPTGPTGPAGPQGVPGPSAFIVGGGTGTQTLSYMSSRFVPLFDSLSATTEATAQQNVPVAGTMSNLRVRLDGAPGFPGSGKSYAITVRKNGADTLLACAILNAATTCSDDSDTITFSADDLISVRVTPSASPTARTVRWTAKFAAQ